MYWSIVEEIWTTPPEIVETVRELLMVDGQQTIDRSPPSVVRRLSCNFSRLYASDRRWCMKI
jgi:hypothetical protein